MAELLILAGGILGIGYILKPETKDSFENIYNTNRTEDITNKVNKLSEARHLASQNPEFSGIYNIAGTRGRTRTPGPPDLPISSRGVSGKSVESFSKENFTGLDMNQKVLDTRYSHADYSPPSTHPNKNTVIKPFIGGPISSFKEGIMSSPLHFKNKSNNDKSKITGLEIEPFDTVNGPYHAIKEEPTKGPLGIGRTRSSRREARGGALDSGTFIQKKEMTESFYHPGGDTMDNIYTGKLSYRDEKNRYANSVFKNGEKPFEPEMVAKPLNWTALDRTSGKETYRTIEELRVNPKEVYLDRVGNGYNATRTSRGVEPSLLHKKRDTYSTKQRLVVDPTTNSAAPAIQDHSESVQGTSREGYSTIERFGNNTFDTSVHNRDTEYMDSTKEAIVNTYTSPVDLSRLNGMNYDHGKSSFLISETERQNYTTPAVTGATVTVKASPITKFLDKVRETKREVYTGDNNRVGNARARVYSSIGDTIDSGVHTRDIAKSTIKEDNLFEYYGNVKAPISSMGYEGTNYDVGTTLKEDVFVERYGNSNSQGKGSDARYSGTEFDSKATLREITSMNNYTTGGKIPQFLDKHINSEYKVSVNTNKLLSEQVDRRLKVGNFPQNTNNSIHFGENTRTFKKVSEIANTRFDTDVNVVNDKIKHNPYAAEIGKIPKT